jgi:hypothetical protein
MKKLGTTAAIISNVTRIVKMLKTHFVLSARHRSHRIELKENSIQS